MDRPEALAVTEVLHVARGGHPFRTMSRTVGECLELAQIAESRVRTSTYEAIVAFMKAMAKANR